MEVKHIDIVGLLGYSVYSTEIENVTILNVTRVGKIQYKVDDNPTGLEFKYIPAEGRIEFDENIPVTLIVLRDSHSHIIGHIFEKIGVTYKV